MLSTRSNVERLLAPRHGPGVCPRCLNLTADSGGLCRACRSGEQHLATVVPISYSVGGEWLHRLIASYKRDADPSVPDAVATLAEICDRFLVAHEHCVAAAAHLDRFDVVTTVPSSSPRRDARHPLSTIVTSVYWRPSRLARSRAGSTLSASRSRGHSRTSRCY
jgi:predicted amidophosphoribosyltransferase